MKRRNTAVIITGLAVIVLLGVLAAQFHVFTKIHQSLCRHEAWENGSCVSCGLVCPHGSWQDGRCTVCGLPCDHQWENGTCTICGQICPHAKYENGICVNCGYACQHSFSDGICIYCQEECRHQWDNGICLICGLPCAHDLHDPETQACLACGVVVPHHYVRGRCACGAEPVFYDGFLPPEYYEECEHPGSVEKLEYVQNLHYWGDIEVTKRMNIYLPYGYTADRQYNVLVLIHGGGDDEDSWMTKVYDYGFPVVMKNIYDRMIEQKLCEPLIIVCPTSYNGPNHAMDSGIEQMAAELRETILPYVASHYSTYAASGEIADLQAARDHFGIGGLSNGSLYALNSGMQMNFDLFSNYICFSGNSQPYMVAEAINSEAWKDLPISYFYAGAGSYDGQRDNSWYGFRAIVDSTDRLVEGENAFYHDINGGHEWAVWHVNMFNALQAAFPVT